MSNNKFELEVENKLENLSVIGEFVEETLNRFGADPATINRVQLAIDEASTNVINYAYEGGSGRLKLVLEMVGDELNISLIDWGTPFDPNTVPDPNLEADLDNRKIGGLGIYFMRKLMDHVYYTFDPKEGNQLRMKKKITKKDLNK
jgi:anti-sigma regulatory factor (Ser/Thr protein kinase)